MVKLIVGNLPPTATNQSLKEIFMQYSDLQDYKLISNYGFVYLATEQSAIHAVYNLNGIEYRGFQITVDYVGENKNKAKVPNLSDPNQFSRIRAPAPNRSTQPLMEQRNLNPYNLPYSNPNSGISQEKRYGPQQPLYDNRNANPYKLQNQNISSTKPLDYMYEGSYGPQTLQDPSYGSMTYSNYYNVAEEDQFRPYESYNEQYIPEEEYFSNVASLKKPRMDPFMDSDTYNYSQSKGTDFTEDDFRFGAQKGSQASWYDLRQMQKQQTFLYPRDEPLYRPQRKRIYQPYKSYIDEYEDDRDYGDIDPYPAYLKQYKK